MLNHVKREDHVHASDSHKKNQPGSTHLYVSLTLTLYREGGKRKRGELKHNEKAKKTRGGILFILYLQEGKYGECSVVCGKIVVALD